jgi:hypothetical protein
VQGPAFELTITGLGSGGEGVGRKDNMTVFVAGCFAWGNSQRGSLSCKKELCHWPIAKGA